MMYRFRANWPFGMLDLLGLIGLGLMAYGGSFLHPALPWLVLGTGLVVYAFITALPPRSQP